MPPKTEKRKTSLEEKPISLTDEINTSDWRCVVMLIVESRASDAALTALWAEEASFEPRKEVKSIDLTSDVTKVLIQFSEGEISTHFTFLLNFSSVFEEAVKYARNPEEMPASLSAQIIKAFIMMMKNQYVEVELKIEDDDPIALMAAKPRTPFEVTGAKDKGGRNNVDIDKKKQGVKPPAVNEGARFKVRPPTNGKKDTTLLRRGQQMKALDKIDDAPENSYYHLYIAVTGFRNPELPMEMVKAGIPLHCVLCLNAGEAVTLHPLDCTRIEIELDQYWQKFPKLLWTPGLNTYFRDIVFLVYAPKEIPTSPKDIRAFIHREISFLLYDLSDLRRQLKNYHRHMRLLNVDEGPDRVEPNQISVHELERLPCDFINIPLIVQYVLDVLCDDDCERGYPKETVSMFTNNILGEMHRSSGSFISLIPFKSTAFIPSRDWSAIVDTNEKNAIYTKLLALDWEYGIDTSRIEETRADDTSHVDVCYVPKNRLPCENLDAEVRNYSEGLLAKYWANYPSKTEETPPSNHLTLVFPQILVNYLLYILWISRIDRTIPDLDRQRSVENVISTNSQTKFTVTDGSRIALHKITQTKDIFSPSQLKIVPPDILQSFSAPQLRPAPKFAWTDRSFVSDSHIPVKYLKGETMTVLEDLRTFLGEEALAKMKDYDFIEELNKKDMIQRIEDAAANYDAVRHAYSPLTDSIYVVMYNNPAVNGLLKEVYNVMLRTPVGLRDFHEYILEDEREWISKQKMGTEGTTRKPQPLAQMYNPSITFRDFTESDFWIEDSIKYSYRATSISNIPTEKLYPGDTREMKEMAQMQEPTDTAIYSQPGEPYDFLGFDLEPGAVQYSGMETTYKGPDYCSVRVSLQERLYGTQQLGLHVQQGGHQLHLYSFACPVPHIEQPYTFHVEYKNGIIAAFSKRTPDVKESASSEDSEVFRKKPEALEDDDQFAYNMKLTIPNGLSVQTVRQHVYPCYIKQAYEFKSKESPLCSHDEKSRLFLPDGSIIKMMADKSVQVLKKDTSTVTASLEDLVNGMSRPNGEGDPGNVPNLYFQSYTETMTNGCRYTVVDGEIRETKRFQIIQNVDKQTETNYFQRMDSTNYITTGDGTTCVRFSDGSKISTSIHEEDVYVGGDYLSYGEEETSERYVLVHQEIVMEHPEYATVIYEGRTSSWRILLPQDSNVEIDSQGWYHVNIDRQTEMEVTPSMIRMWRYSPRDEFITSTIVDLNVFGREPFVEYCVTTDTTGRKFTVGANGNCRVDEQSMTNEETVTTRNETEDTIEPKRYFVVRRDLTGFEIIHTKYVTKEVKDVQPEVVTHCQELGTVPLTRYFAFLKACPQKASKWGVKSITPEVTCRRANAQLSTTYGVPPSWMHPFPKRKQKATVPEVLEGRIMLEIKPTNCPCPTFNGSDYAFYDTSHLPEPKISLKDDPQILMRKVANQDQDTLKDIYCAAIKKRVASNKLVRPRGPELEHYLKMSEWHVKNRETLKHAIANRIILGYFYSPSGMAWLILQSIIDGIITEDAKGSSLPEPPPVTSRTEFSADSSEVEYNLEWPSDPSCSDLSYRSNLSLRTAPPTVGAVLSSPKATCTPRGAISEPIYKIEDNANMNMPRANEGSSTSSQICVFTKEDLLTLEHTSPPREKEPERPAYDLEDLMNLGLL